MRRAIVLLSASLITLSASAAPAQNAAPRNLILFIRTGCAQDRQPADRARHGRGARQGRQLQEFAFAVSTFTMANGSAMASGHYLGDTGTFSNTIYTGYSSVPAGDTVVPFIENDAVLGDVDEHSAATISTRKPFLKMARAKGFSTGRSASSAPRCCSTTPTEARTPS